MLVSFLVHVTMERILQDYQHLKCLHKINWVTQMTDTRPNILTSKDLNIPATKSTSSTQTQKDVASNTNENDEGEETTWNIETDPFFSGTKLNIFL